MHARALLLAFLLAATLSIMPVGTSNHLPCVPSQDLTAHKIEGPDRSLYVRERTLGTARYVEIFQETNEFSGLQTSTGMACGHAPDRVLLGTCVNSKPTLGPNGLDCPYLATGTPQ